MRECICAPVLPEITDAPRDLEALVKAAKRSGRKIHFCQSAISQTLFGGGVSCRFWKSTSLPWSNFIGKRYADRAFLPKGYTERLSRLMTSLRQKYGIGTELRNKAPHEPGTLQPTATRLISERSDGVRETSLPLAAIHELPDRDLPPIMISPTWPSRRRLRRPTESRRAALLAARQRRAGSQPTLVAV